MLIASSSEQIKTPTAIALGNFDGIHQGHRTVLRPIIDSFKSTQQPHIYPSVVSFTPHPREFFTGGKLQLLTPIPQKAELLSNLGIEQLVLLPFNSDLASLTPQQFVQQIIVEKLQATFISVGEDFRFGYQRKGTAADLKNIAADYDIEVQLNSLYKYGDRHHQQVRVSSSLIRQALSEGDMKTANLMLDRPYSLWGTVVTGQQLGRTIGFPTANLQLPREKFLPRFGVYAAKVLFAQTILKGVMNIGCRPTVAGVAPTIEVHLLNWSGDLYGQTLKVNLIEFLRPEQKFDSLAALKQQISQDCQSVLESD
ncbi:bifunctional riboflavin kinase/FAD synthetase [Pleurocapsa sp. CCALA 161]|uniref:bifunctional riboflavin kinase/FAD synthetase n=1 Tax=Pleurocapsa sp. CCALA 161 TaxID=2107688 RepID=UPI000D06F751|nr:bifunctional riboflavin kinase/FAD synthetase [Pleurocapsa sp. CCALA 161]PSB12838.1 bifunctional riboflavin kinase/FAD synthetase [Pleurocapsa sp. CCALA 161]